MQGLMVHEGPDLEKSPGAGRELWALASQAALGWCPHGFLSPRVSLSPRGVLPRGSLVNALHCPHLQCCLPYTDTAIAGSKLQRPLGCVMLVLTKVRMCLSLGLCPGGCMQPHGLSLLCRLWFGPGEQGGGWRGTDAGYGRTAEKSPKLGICVTTQLENSFPLQKVFETRTESKQPRLVQVQ